MELHTGNLNYFYSFCKACQGGGIDRGVEVDKEEADDDDAPKSLPTEADVFIFFATPFGKTFLISYINIKCKELFIVHVGDKLRRSILFYLLGIEGIPRLRNPRSSTAN